MPTSNEIRNLVEKDRFELMMRCPFYGRIICSAELVVVSDPQVRLACTDYRRIFISGDAYSALPEKKRLAVLAHEVLHIALRHAFRIGDRDKNRFEKAADIEVTFVLTESFPDPYGIKVKVEWRALTAEQIYELLPPREDKTKAKSEHCSPEDDKEGGSGSEDKQTSNNDTGKTDDHAEERDNRNDNSEDQGRESKNKSSKSKRPNIGDSSGDGKDGSGDGKDGDGNGSGNGSGDGDDSGDGKDGDDDDSGNGNGSGDGKDGDGDGSGNGNSSGDGKDGDDDDSGNGNGSGDGKDGDGSGNGDSSGDGSGNGDSSGDGGNGSGNGSGDGGNGSGDGSGNGNSSGDGSGNGDSSGDGKDGDGNGSGYGGSSGDEDGGDGKQAPISEFRPQFDAETEMNCIALSSGMLMDMKMSGSGFGKGIGSAPGFLKRLLNKLNTPRVNWQILLRQFIRLCRGGGYSWMRPNRRFISCGLYLPGRQTKNFSGIVALDTSGSTTGALPQFVAELTGLLKSFGKFDLTIIECDAKIQQIWTVSSNEPMPDLTQHKFEGGGGTDFTPVFGYIRDHHLAPNVLIFFTDGCGPCPENKPPYPVLWMLTQFGRAPVPWGQVIYYEES